MKTEACSIFYCVDVLWKHVVIFLVYNTNYEMCGLSFKLILGLSTVWIFLGGRW